MKTNKTYAEISKETGLSISHVSRVLRGLKEPSIRVLCLLAWSLDMSAEDFLKGYKKAKKATR